MSDRPVKISKRWRRVAELYKYFAQQVVVFHDEQPHEKGRAPSALDFSEESARALYLFESGQSQAEVSHLPGAASIMNGYAVGKFWLGVQIEMWRAEFDGRSALAKWPLFADPDLRQLHWWLDSLFGKDVGDSRREYIARNQL